MQTTPKKRSTILVAVGAGVFMVGTGLAALATRDTGGSNNHAARTDTPVTAPAPAGAVKTAAGATTFVIPADHQAMAVQVPFVQGLAGYAKAGDLVNVYGEYRTQPPTAAPEDPVAKLVLQKVKVLAVNPGADGGNATYVLSVSTADAETVMYLSTFQKVWLTLARDDQGVLSSGKGFSIHNG
jgi:Flp pilus assembly protein CpaB